MIKPQDVVLHLGTYLPRVTDRFSVTLPVVQSEVISAQQISVESASHGLSAGTPLAISAGRVENPITAAQLGDSGQRVMFTTGEDHDFNSPSAPNIPNNVTLRGFTNPVYNTTHQIYNVPNRRNLIINLPTGETTAPTLNGNEVAEEDRNAGIKGFHTVTSVTDANNFVVQINNVPPLPVGPITGLEILTNVRVVSAADIQRAREIYTKQDPGQEIWAFVIMGDLDVSKDRHTLNDSTAGFTFQDMALLRFLQNFSVAVFIPTVQDLSGSAAQNLAYDDIYNSLVKVLYGFGFNDPDSAIQYVTVTTGHGSNPPYNASWYEHVYDWQLPFAVDFSDGFDEVVDVAFRDIESTWDVNRDAAAQMILNINLDEEPLP